jgi:hypothetical protein
MLPWFLHRPELLCDCCFRGGFRGCCSCGCCYREHAPLRLLPWLLLKWRLLLGLYTLRNCYVTAAPVTTSVVRGCYSCSCSSIGSYPPLRLFPWLLLLWRLLPWFLYPQELLCDCCSRDGFRSCYSLGCYSCSCCSCGCFSCGCSHGFRCCGWSSCGCCSRGCYSFLVNCTGGSFCRGCYFCGVRFRGSFTISNGNDVAGCALSQ